MKRSKEAAIGLAFIAAIALLFAGIRFLKGRNLFANKETYFVHYNNVTGLSDASPIYTNGVRIGIVDEIFYNPKQPDDIIVRILVDRRLQIPQDSKALLETELLGSVSVNLQLGANYSKFLDPGDTIQGRLNKGIMSEIIEAMPALLNIAEKADTLLSYAQILLSDSSISKILKNTEEITSQTSNKLDELSNLMKEISYVANTYDRTGTDLDTLVRQVCEITQTVQDEEWLGRLTQVIDNLETLSTQLASGSGTAGKIINDTQLYENLDETCSEARKLIEDIRKNPSRYIRIFGKTRQ